MPHTCTFAAIKIGVEQPAPKPYTGEVHVCDTGAPSVHTIRADYTCTFAALKTGYTQPAAKLYTGKVEECDIGAPPRLIEETAGK